LCRRHCHAAAASLYLPNPPPRHTTYMRCHPLTFHLRPCCHRPLRIATALLFAAVQLLERQSQVRFLHTRIPLSQTGWGAGLFGTATAYVSRLDGGEIILLLVEYPAALCKQGMPTTLCTCPLQQACMFCAGSACLPSLICLPVLTPPATLHPCPNHLVSLFSVVFLAPSAFHCTCP
jgi:hypothetical protein